LTFIEVLFYRLYLSLETSGLSAKETKQSKLQASKTAEGALHLALDLTSRVFWLLFNIHVAFAFSLVGLIIVRHIVIFLVRLDCRSLFDGWRLEIGLVGVCSWSCFIV
jgi:hypothetical protein